MTTNALITFADSLRASFAEIRSMLTTLRALAAGRIELADSSGCRGVVVASGFAFTDPSGAKVVAEVSDGEASVMAATDYDGDVIRAADDD